MASPNISFDQIPSSVRKPGKYFEFNTKLAVRTLPGNPQKILLVGQRLASAGASAIGVLEPVDVFSDVDAAVYFGYGSIAHLMVKAAITANAYAQLTVIALDDAAAGVAATGKVSVTGPATAVGTMSLTIAGQRVDIAIDNGATAAQIATKLVAAIAAIPALPVNASAAQGEVTLTAKHKGAAGNGIALSASVRASGVGTVVTAMAEGQNDPDLGPALAAMFAAGHNIVVSPFATSEALTALRSHLEAVGHPFEQRDAIGIAGIGATLSAASTLADSINSGLISLGWHNGSVRSAAEIAAGYASVVASEEDPARPLNTLAIAGLDVTPITARPGRVEQENALYNGVTPFEIGPGDKVQIVRAITTYTVNPAGVDDVALLDLTTMRTLHYVRKACRERIELRFPREKLSAKTPPKVRSELLDVLLKLEELEIVEDVQNNQQWLLVERDSQDVNRLNARIPVDVVNGLHIFAGRIDLLL